MRHAVPFQEILRRPSSLGSALLQAVRTEFKFQKYRPVQHSAQWGRQEEGHGQRVSERFDEQCAYEELGKEHRSRIWYEKGLSFVKDIQKKNQVLQILRGMKFIFLIILFKFCSCLQDQRPGISLISSSSNEAFFFLYFFLFFFPENSKKKCVHFCFCLIYIAMINIRTKSYLGRKGFI